MGSQSQKKKNSKDEKESKYGMCEVVVGAKVKAVMCDMCDIWYHIKCANISEEGYDSVKEWKMINWVCDKCVRTKHHKKDTGNENQLIIRMNDLMNRMEENSKESKKKGRIS